MGASLSFHGADQPIITLLELYEKFGFEFDHIYGFEISFANPKRVYEKLLRKSISQPTIGLMLVSQSSQIKSTRLLRGSSLLRAQH